MKLTMYLFFCESFSEQGEDHDYCSLVHFLSEYLVLAFKENFSETIHNCYQVALFQALQVLLFFLISQILSSFLISLKDRLACLNVSSFLIYFIIPFHLWQDFVASDRPDL